MTRGEPLRRRLFLLAAAAIVPLAAAAGIALLALAKEQRAQGERAGVELSRALGTAVDAELHRSVAALEAIAQGPALDTGDLKRFHEVMRRVHEDRPDWVTTTLADTAGRQLANAVYPFGTVLSNVVDPASLERVARSRKPVIGVLSRGPRGELAVPVRVPVLRGGDVRYVLTAALKPDSLAAVVNRQRVPSDWVVSVFDAKNIRVARSRQHAEFLNRPPAPTLLELMKRGEEGTGISYALEGEQVYTAFSRSRATGWTVAIGIPPAAVEAGAARSLAVYGGGFLLSIALGVIAALAIGRGITAPMAWLSAAAQALGRRETLVPPQTPIREIREVGNALAAAAVERELHEAEREQILRREQEARAAAEAASRAKDEFLAMLGHELRNPLGAIANASRLLEHPQVDAQSAKRAREVISRQAEHLARLTDDLLDAGRAIMGKIVLERQPLELSAVVARALDTLQAAGRLGGHRLEQALEPVWINADDTRVEQIVVNLVGNALKFTPERGTISVRVRPDGDEAVLSVRDTGVGMSPELGARVFDPFVQGESALDRRQGGLGIGLTLVRRLAELHSGYASAASEGPGRGSEFTVRFPAIDAPAAAAPDRPAIAGGPQRRILIVEDNEDAADTLRQLLELAGHKVQVAHDGVAGLEALLANPPELALIDVGLPRMDGYELARRARVAAKGKRLPLLVAVTGYGLPEDRARALAAGFDEHLIKPVDVHALAVLLAKPGLASGERPRGSGWT
jgi:signal transduction histidine kinase/ActR/RegA family two-component response regulator